MRSAAILSGIVLLAALPAQRALLDLLPADADVDGHLEVAFGDEFTPLTLPGSGTVFGLAKVGDRCWVLRGSDLHCLDWRTQKVDKRLPAPAELVGLCADAQFLYGIAGRDLHVLDARAGTSMRTVPIDAVWPPAHVFEHEGEVHVVIDRKVLTVDVRTGATKELPRQLDAALWFASDGQCLWRGTADGCRPELGIAPAWSGRRWPKRVSEMAATWVDGKLLVAFEHHDRKLPAFGLLATTVADVEPGERLMITKNAGALGYMITSHEPLDDDGLRAALRKVAAQRPPPVVELAPFGAGVTVADVRKVWDLVVAAGIADVRCPGLESWARERQRAARPAPEPSKK